MGAQALRRALIAEHAGQIVPELVQGESAEELEASLEVARAAYQRVAQQALASMAAQVPTGAPPRAEPSAEDFSPLQKIASALNHRG